MDGSATTGRHRLPGAGMVRSQVKGFSSQDTVSCEPVIFLEKNMHMFLESPWAIERSALMGVANAANAAENQAPGNSRRASANYRLDNGVAEIQVAGVLAPTDSAFLGYIGGTPLDAVGAAFRHAVANPAVKQIVLAIDSPGGQVTGVSELADLIYSARGVKPITARVGGAAASAAYWIASAADRIEAGDTSVVGSIGVVVLMFDARRGLQAAGIDRYEIVSSQSPKKRPDVSTDAGRAQILATLDGLMGVFVSKVSRNRGVTSDTVIGKFGQGDILVGTAALQAGMVDRIVGIAPATNQGDAWATDKNLRAEFGDNESAYRAYAAAAGRGEVRTISGKGVFHG